ncbi:hypothetical protein [Geomicrobium sp. JCM 19038]|uniref:hypothetical protein n=1 Tax=Geomicrobium sp. JCM 19038 TaxID=1460635 RepID=UPI00045F305F|nr:hypothetical protein [Geomicrobium sp. JCM 19038]GAK09003.1 hypothetical protein JCM19038_2813 [Geomicrobium sp. JCM 19038]
MDVTEQANYVSADESVATVNGTGQITAVGSGSTQITVSYEGETATVDVTVEEEEEDPELQSISAEPSNVTLEQGESQNVTVNANYE